ncbi:uncharacterized protein ISCGN_009217 [Ixodes scapularis]
MAAADCGPTADSGSTEPGASSWSTSLSKIPQSFDGDKVESYRTSRLRSSRQAARSYKFVTEAYIDPSSIRVSSSTAKVCVKASCFRSQKKNSRPYQVSCGILYSGLVCNASCECAAGTSGVCNHSLALLKLLALLRAKDYAEAPPVVACTELPQQWRRPRGEAVASTSLQSVDWRSVREDGSDVPISSKLYDARRKPLDQNETMLSIRKLGADRCSSDVTPFAKRLREATADSVETRFGLAPVGSPLSYQHSLVPFGYETYISPELSLVQRRTTALPSDPAFFESGVAWDTSGHNFPLQQDLLLKSLLVTSTQATVLEKNTRQQSKSPLWRAARRNRLTASSFGEVATRESWSLKGLNNLTSTKDISHVRAVRHGIKYEPAAVQRYESALRVLGHDIQTSHCGIVVQPDCPWLGASPDRTTWDPTEATAHGVVETEERGWSELDT